jgi:hypothetical protein
MTRIISAAVLVIAVMALAPVPAQAGGQAPWCAVINQGRDSYWDCHYSTFEACYPTVLAGNRGFCNENPAYEGAPAPRRKAARRHRTRNY